MNTSSTQWSFGDGHMGSHWPDGRGARNNSTMSKMQHQYWVTKETVLRKLGKKEDEHIVASDAELDAKLELFRSIQDSCFELQRIIDRYQERICFLAQEENAMGRFLKEAGKADKTGAGSLMVSLGKAMSVSGQQRITLRAPLLRLYQEVDTFRGRAVEDTQRTVTTMERFRTKYRASLNWMKDVSQSLDPDAYTQLEKFKKVQSRVKVNKANFDRYKRDTLEKVDLLAAARCNMFSHALSLYHSGLLQFAASSAAAYQGLADVCKEHSHYEFTVVRELSELRPETPSLFSNPQPSEDVQNEIDDKLLDFDDLDPDLEQEKIDKEISEDLTGLLTTNASSYLPSQLLLHGQLGISGEQTKVPSQEASLLEGSRTDHLTDNTSLLNDGVSDTKPLQDGSSLKSKTSWLDLFSELDPLSNPDSIGQGVGTLEPFGDC